MYTFKSLKTSELGKLDIKKIIKLKDTFWEFGERIQYEWFIKNIKKNDIHNLLFKNKIFVGYTCLRKKKILINNLKSSIFLFDTIIINKNHRKKGVSKILMNKNNLIIKKKKLMSVLICNKNLINNYKKFNWKTESKKKIKFIKLKVGNKSILVFNVKSEFKKMQIFMC